MSWKETARDPLPTAGHVIVPPGPPAHHGPWGSFPWDPLPTVGHVLVTPAPPAHRGPCARYLGPRAHRWPCAPDPRTPCPPLVMCSLSRDPLPTTGCVLLTPGPPAHPVAVVLLTPGPPASHRPLRCLGQVNPPKSGLYAGPLAAGRAAETGTADP